MTREQRCGELLGLSVGYVKYITIIDNKAIYSSNEIILVDDLAVLDILGGAAATRTKMQPNAQVNFEIQDEGELHLLDLDESFYRALRKFEGKSRQESLENLRLALNPNENKGTKIQDLEHRAFLQLDKINSGLIYEILSTESIKGKTDQVFIKKQYGDYIAQNILRPAFINLPMYLSNKGPCKGDLYVFQKGQEGLEEVRAIVSLKEIERMGLNLIL